MSRLRRTHGFVDAFIERFDSVLRVPVSSDNPGMGGIGRAASRSVTT
jgi:hypothetical protein